MKVIIINLIFLIFISSCTRGFRTKKLLYSTPKTAFYEIKRDEVPGKQLLEGKLIHPTKLEASKITDIIGNIKFTKTTRINKFTDFIFHQDQLDSFSEDLSLSLEKLDDKKVLVAISQHDHLNSVISTYKRTSFYMWVNEEGLNIVFGEIQGDVPWEDSGNFYDWTQIEKITLGQHPDENEIIWEREFFDFKKIKGYYNRKWLVFSLADLDKYKLNRILNTNNPE